ncbi:hypothetical protein Bca4012_096832 [Brassica carinata]|uniref:Uncharacterized protein n=3 Tax=Brassica TaxID=3705 RepID=A0A0D3DXN1_BRAOL|nr:unnamed protein product [Brassica napus]VDD59006.1 unnamed protein product [Brassica oleracea]
MYESANVSDDADRTAFRASRETIQTLLRTRLKVLEKYKWIRESLTSFPQPPNRTNHNAIYGPVADLFDSAKANKVLVQAEMQISSFIATSRKKTYSLIK